MGFLKSAMDVDPLEPIVLKDAEVPPEAREKLCDEFTDIFSKDSSDLGKTPLLKIDILTGDSPPVSQKPYTLALKHVQWVREEIETLEKAGVIVRSISPWASPIVIVPKKTMPGEPPQASYVRGLSHSKLPSAPCRQGTFKSQGDTNLGTHPKDR